MNKLFPFILLGGYLLYANSEALANRAGLSKDSYRIYKIDGKLYKVYSSADLPPTLVELLGSNGKYYVVEKTVYNQYLVVLNDYKKKKAAQTTPDNWLDYLLKTAPQLLKDIVKDNKNHTPNEDPDASLDELDDIHPDKVFTPTVAPPTGGTIPR